MARESTVFGVSVLGVIVGLLILLFGEASHLDGAVYGGGVVVLAAVGVMALAVARL